MIAAREGRRKGGTDLGAEGRRSREAYQGSRRRQDGRYYGEVPTPVGGLKWGIQIGHPRHPKR